MTFMEKLQFARFTGTPLELKQEEVTQLYNLFIRHVVPALQDFGMKPCHRSNCGTVCLCGSCNARKALETLLPGWRPR